MGHSVPAAPILLTHANHLFADAKQARRSQPYPPLQLLLVAACLRRAGMIPQVVDTTFDDPLPALAAAIERRRPALLIICEDHFNFVTKMCLTCHRELALDLCAAARQAGIPVVVSSSDAVDHPAPYLHAGADAVVVGEAEETLLEAAGAILRGGIGALAGVPGLAIAGGASIRRTPPREPVADLDRLPMPAWDLVDMAPYRAAWNSVHGFFSLNMAASRGCPYHCNWCAKPIFGQRFRVRSPRAVAAEMRYLHERHAPDRVWFADDIFGLSPRWLADFAREVESAGARVPFKIQTRCDLVTPQTVESLRRAGCAEVWMGAESGSQKILDAMEKGLQTEAIYRARACLRSAGIRAGFFLQFGYPGEGWDEIQETVRMVRQTVPDEIGVSVSYPLPGTRFHQIVNAQLGRQRNWSDSADLAMMYRGAYSSEFYRALHDALHGELEMLHGRRAGTEVAALWTRLDALREETVCASC